MGQGMMGCAGMGLLMAVVLLLVIAGVVLLAVWLVRLLSDRSSADPRSTTPGVPGPAEQTPLAMLQRRYARGEIGREEYEQIRSDLMRHGAG